MEGDVITLQDIFVCDHSAGFDHQGKALGGLIPTGLRPKFPGEDDPLQRHRRPADLLPRCPMTLHVTSMAIADLPGWTMYAGLVAVGIGLLGVLILAIPKPREMSAEGAVELLRLRTYRHRNRHRC